MEKYIGTYFQELSNFGHIPTRYQVCQQPSHLHIRSTDKYLDEIWQPFTKPVRNIKKRNHQFTHSPIHEFQVLQNVF